MAVLPTNKWLEVAYDSPEKIYNKLAKYFHNQSTRKIADILISNGMYQKSEKNGDKLVKLLLEKNVWGIIKQEENYLKQKWNGINIPIFIFPSNPYNRKITEQYNGRNGLAFYDKIFLFVSETTTEEELKALFTHEYNHACRLKHHGKKEDEYTLLDLVVLEGLAENAVQERFGKEQLAPWTKYYSEKELKNIWNKFIYPNKDLSKFDQKTSKLLYGNSFIPNMAGYSTGYYIVRQFIIQTRLKSHELLTLPTENFTDINL
ncbi:DUF2268 domain-containing protein [Ornithinibacillus halotolerans]|uniref:DUF2268 domain-containing protein n=1 Tax=Ornithinibacillus halotolerans TaxID=1274357 RepID=A0A916WD03_9BACI|nr:DUF2268 domain-containing protein [Ornithinibacillus halotolerans]GGA87342.1 hypothetical protein GCM10008025_32710 [Ornithinibacillus halotolerans]